MTDTSTLGMADKPHRYCLVIIPAEPTDDRINYWSGSPFASFSVGDEVSRWSYRTPPDSRTIDTGSDAADLVVARVVREVVDDGLQILDTTWIHLGPRGN